MTLRTRSTYDDFVEASTFAQYATLPGEGGGIFRDSEQAKAKAKQFRELEKKAYRACGLGSCKGSASLERWSRRGGCGPEHHAPG